MKSIVITGVSSGIGYSTAAALLQRGYRVFGSVRRESDAQRLCAELGGSFTPLLFDVTDREAIAAAEAEVGVAVGLGGVHALINNAGIVLPGPLLYSPLEDVREHFEVNVLGLLDVTQQFAPLLGARPNPPHPAGRIVNISSVSGRIAYPFMGAYAASKHAVEALSDALRRELMLYGVDVVVVEPGTTRTPIKDKYAEQVRRYADSDYAKVFSGLEAQLAEREKSGLPVEKVVDVIVEAVESERPRARYAVPRKRFSGWLFPRLLPDRWLDRIIAGRLGLKRE